MSEEQPPIFPEVVRIIRETHKPWSTDKNGKDIYPEWEQISNVEAHSRIVKLFMKWHEADKNAAVREVVEKVGKVVDEIGENAKDYQGSEEMTYKPLSVQDLWKIQRVLLASLPSEKGEHS